LDSRGEYTIRLTKGIDERQLADKRIERMVQDRRSEGRFHDTTKATIGENLQYYIIESIMNCQMKEKVENIQSNRTICETRDVVEERLSGHGKKLSMNPLLYISKN
jgi:hypothetical protein